MNLAAAGAAFLIILPAELPDKTVVACLVMGSRYRPVFVFAGAAAAFTAHVALAVTAGGLLGLLPHRPGPGGCRGLVPDRGGAVVAPARASQ